MYIDFDRVLDPGAADRVTPDGAFSALTAGQAPLSTISASIAPDGRWPVPKPDELLVVPLGGLGRIGMNWTLYGTDGRWLLVDAGLAFPDKDMEGVDCIVPDPAYLEPIIDRLCALVVTHAHEDHIGSVAKLWPTAMDCPIYASPFATGILNRRFDEARTRAAIDLRTFQVGSSFEIGPFKIRTVRMTHSVPEPVSLAITTSVGTVMHTGDWKFDPNPLIGQPTDFDALREIGDAGVLAMLADSTNAHKELPITSEADVAQAFRSIFANRTGMVVVCCFATNVARMASAVTAAHLSGRQVALAGRSMRNCEETAREVGLLSGIPSLLAEPRHLRGLERHEMALVCTGTQGEENAALARMARGDRRLPLLSAGDTVILSSRVIPGNEEAVEPVVEQLLKRGVEVIRSGDTADGCPVHVSGHPGREELRTLYGLIRPRFAVPVHGHMLHQEAHTSLARRCGVEKALLAEECEIIRLTAQDISVEESVHVPHLHVARDARGNAVPVKARHLVSLREELAPA